MASSRIVRRAVLERLGRPLLARLLRQEAAAFCADHALSIDDLESSPTHDRTLVHRLYQLLHAPDTLPSPPPGLIALLESLDVLGTTAGGDTIVDLDTAHVLPRATLGDEDLALTALLDHPELAKQALAVVGGVEMQSSFTEYEPRTALPLRFEPHHAAAVEKAMAPRLGKKGRHPYCEIHATIDGDVVSIELVCGRRAKTFDTIDGAANLRSASTQTHGERVFAELDRTNGRLALHGIVGTRTMLQEALGEVLAGDPNHFRPARIYDMSPFALPEDVVSAAGVPGLLSVAIHSISARTPKRTVITFARPREDLVDDEPAFDLLPQALAIGVPVAVKVYLRIEGRSAPLKLELSVTNDRNRVDFKRDDERVVEIVRAWMRARGILRDVPEAVVSVAHRGEGASAGV